METETSTDLSALLIRLSDLLEEAGEPRWSARLGHLLGSEAEAGQGSRQSQVREILALHGGMGS